MGLVERGMMAGGLMGIAMGVDVDPANLPLAAWVSVTASVPVGRSAAAVAAPFESVPVAMRTGVLLVAVVYVKVTEPVGGPAAELTVAVSVTGWPRVVVVVLAASAVVVLAASTVTCETEEVEPALAMSP